MPSTPRGARRALAASAGLAVAVTGLSVFATSPATANPAGTALVISEVYGGGGNAGATLKNDFIELYNPTNAAISVAGMSVQYRSSGSSSAATGVTELSGSVPARGHYLVKQAAGTGGTADLPAVDATGEIAMSGTAFTAWLANGTTALNPGINSAVGTPGVIDLVGVNSNTFETAKTVAASNSTSLARAANGTDTDNNSADFTSGAPTPTGSGGGQEPEPEPEPVTVTIPEIQGTGSVSPLVGDPVETRGVVTAVYPEGGLFGYYLQTPGSGGAVDSTPGASDGIFVRQPSGAVTVTRGSYVEVTGTVAEFAGQTQLSVLPTDVTVLGETAAPVLPTTTLEWPDTDAEKEALEGMLYQPSVDFTVTNTFSTNQFGEVGLAVGDKPLVQPTEVADAQDAAAIAAVVADNAARAITLDDAASTNFTAAPGNTLTPAYVSNEEPVRVGARATIDEPVILTQGGSSTAPTYRFQPRERVVGPDNAASPATFENTRTAAPDSAAIDPTGTADVKVASFNVLNYFTTLGDANDDNVGDGGCLSYQDRLGDGTNVREGCDQRGAWDPQDFARQQEKIVAAINALDADVVGLMEIENSAKLGETPDEATGALVAALNADAGAGTWAANPSSSDLPPVAEMDVITNAIIYKPGAVKRLGASRALGELSGAGEAFDNAREPLAQAFTPVAGGESFLVVVNHFKSKGSGTDDGTGQGNANPDRVAQARALAAWVPTVQTAIGVEPTLLMGDFNSYAMEDPLQVLYAEDYVNVEKHSGSGDFSYSFSGLSGSLDHVLANPAAMELYTGTDTWNINSGESLAMEYSRHDYHATDFHEATPYRSSDHDPVIMGLDTITPTEPEPEPEPEPTPVKATISVKHSPSKVVAGKTRATLKIKVSAKGAKPTGKVTVKIKGGKTLKVTLKNGKATVKLPKFATPGTKKLTVVYRGDDRVKGESVTYRIKVVKKKN
ncbi:ExeM/NucH family extracellular endonuclease [Nocardioides dongkuii]|uniref:ExeM/NucH family extracellular endonuclease n=1 Tax=Nocardioides dongkuii TaxID=2760089 RepID=UPI0015F9F676|nr:ExeM/NucH family extracellular endonuclease [Nocardioides dongkuii]